MPNIELHYFKEASTKIRDIFNLYSNEIIEQASIEIKYENYIQKEEQVVKKMASLENMKIKEDINYDQIGAISHEAREKLKRTQPLTIGQASRISGVSPYDISILMVYLGK